MNFVITLSKLLWILLNPSTHMTVTLVQNLSSDAVESKGTTHYVDKFFLFEPLNVITLLFTMTKFIVKTDAGKTDVNLFFTITNYRRSLRHKFVSV